MAQGTNLVIPFVLNVTESNREEQGVRVNAICNIHHYDRGWKFDENYRWIQSDAKGFWGAGLWNYCKSFSGFEFAGLSNINEGSLTGGSVSLIVGNYIEERLNGWCYGTMFNRAGENGKFALQIGCFNVIKEYDPSGVVIQLGIHNRAGNQTAPFINFRGLGHLFEKEKKGKKKDLEAKTE